MDEVLTILGASARAAAQSAVRAGLRPLAGDLFADADLRSIGTVVRVANYPTGLADVCAGPQPGAWMYTGSLENYPALLQQMAAVRPLWGNDAGTVQRVRNPMQVAQVLLQAGLNCPAVTHLHDGLPRDGRWLRKSLRSTGAGHIVPWTDEAAVHEFQDDHYFQERIDGLACSAVYVAARREAVLLGATRQWIGPEWPGAPVFRYAGSLGPLTLAPEERSQLRRLGQALAAAFELRGLFGVDLVHNSAGYWPVEVNPRYTASVEVLERGLGIAALTWHAAAYRDDKLPSEPSRASASCCGKAIVYAAHTGRATADLERLAAERDMHDGWPNYGDVPAAGTIVRAGAPLLTVFARAADEQTTLQQLRQRSALVARLWPVNQA